MSLFVLSLIANAALLALLLFVWSRAKARIVEEKLATFAGAMNAMTFGLAAAEPEMRWDRVAFGLKGMLGSTEQEEIRWRLVRASIMRLLRPQHVSADLGEHVRALTLECSRGEQEAEDVWAYIDGVMAKEPGFEQEPGERFSSAELAKAQFQLEADIYRMYAIKLNSQPLRIMG